jgi:histidinol dehydrogenase
MRILNSQQPDFNQLLEESLKPTAEVSAEAAQTVEQILKRVKREGNRALIELELELDGVSLSAQGLKVTPREIEQAYEQVNKKQVEHLREAARRIEAFHQRQLQSSWFTTEAPGIILGQLIRPIARVGVYVPGGKASYPSSVLMNIIPARVAGVEDIIICSPPTKDGGIAPGILIAADITGVADIYKLGGAQAVAAMAYGTETIPKVDKIAGPGNIYVSLAKKMVYGQVGIDMLAGPSEILIIADDTAQPAYVAADLLSQAEHDELARPLLITTSEKLAHRVEQELDRQLDGLERKNIALEALENNGMIILVATLDEALELANRIAPEHLELAIADPHAALHRIQHAGAVFLGHYTPEALGDYIAGPNHVLPTGGGARFSSPLGVYDFIKRTSMVYYNQDALTRQGKSAMGLARMEGLEAHAHSVKVRLKEDL